MATGRWQRRPREERVCPHCHDGIEDAPTCSWSARCTPPCASSSPTCSLSPCLPTASSSNPRPASLPYLGVAIPELAEALLERHVASYTHASVKVQRYIEDVWGGSISAEAYTPASILCDVPERRRRVRLAQWRTGSHWMAEETGRWQRLDRTQRPCPHRQAPLEDVRHAVYDCPLYAGLREEYAELFHSPGHALPSLAAFLGQARQGRLARFADRCHEEHAAALAQ